MEDKYQTEIDPSEPSFDEENKLPAINVPQAEAEQPNPLTTQPESAPGIAVDWTHGGATPWQTEEQATYKEEDDLQALKDLVTYQSEMDRLKLVGSSIGREIDGAVKSRDQRPILPIDGIDEERPSTAAYQRMYAPTEGQRQGSMLEGVGLGYWMGQYGSTMKLYGEGLIQRGKALNDPTLESYGESLSNYGKWYEGNAPKQKVQHFLDVDSTKKALQYGVERVEGGLGSSLPSLAMAAAAKVMGVPGAPALAVANNFMGVGQARQSLGDEYNSLMIQAENADIEGDPVRAAFLRDEAKKVDPESNTKMIEATGAFIGMAEFASDKIEILRGLPDGLKRDIKAKLYRKLVSHVARRAAEGFVAEGITGAAQDFASAVQVIHAKGAYEWLKTMDAVDKELEQAGSYARSNIPFMESGQPLPEGFDPKQNLFVNLGESFVAGGAGGAGVAGGVGFLGGIQQARMTGTQGVGAGSETPKQGPALDFTPPAIAEPTAPEVVPPPLKDAQRGKLEDYLKDPNNLTRPEDYGTVGKALGIPEEQVPAVLEGATQEGLLRKDSRGIYRRGKAEAKPIIPETGELSGNEFILPESATQAAPQETTEAAPDGEMVSAAPSEAQAPVAEATVGTDQVAIQIDPATTIREIEGRIASKQQELADVRSGIKGASPEEQATIKERSNAIRTELKTLQKELKQAEAEPAKVAQPEETTAKPEAPAATNQTLPQDKPARTPEQTQEILTKAKEVLPDLTDAEADLVSALVDRGVPVDDAIEVAIKDYADGIARQVGPETQQRPVSQEPAAEGDRPGSQAAAPTVREGNAQPSQASAGNGLLTKEDVATYESFRGAMRNSALAMGQRIEQALRVGFGLTEEQKTKRVIKKLKPVTKTNPDGSTTKLQVKWFDQQRKGWTDDAKARFDTFRGKDGSAPSAFYLPDEHTIYIARYAAETGDNARSLLTHELVHALLRFDVISMSDVNALAKVSEESGLWAKGRDTLYRRGFDAQGVKGKDADPLIQEEKAAYLLQTYMDGKVKLEKDKGLVQEILDRIVELLNNLRNAFKQEKIEALDVLNSLLAIKIGNGQAGRFATNEDLVKAISKIRADLRREDMSKPNALLAAIKAWHGSPHDFEYFDLSKIGTGEGAQAYGHGLYFTDTEKVARGYRDVLARRDAPFSSLDEKYMREAVQWLRSGRSGNISAGGLSQINDAVSDFKHDYANGPRDNVPDSELADYIEGAYKERGALYEVTINADPEQDFLDWDKPLSQQNNRSKDALKKIADEELDSISKARFDVRGGEPKYVTELRTGIESGSIQASQLYMRRKPEQITKLLQEHGITGIKYLDGNSRGSGQGTYNYVIFDEKIIEIVSKNGEPVKRSPLLAAMKIDKDDAPQGKSVTDIVDETASEMAAKPAPVIGTKRPTLSIPGLQKPMSPAEAGEKLRLEQEGKAKLLGPFAPRAELSDWLGIPLVGFQADIQHILNKRTAKDANVNERLGRERLRPMQSLEEVRAVIEKVLDNAQFAHKYKTDGWTLVYQDGNQDYVVGLYPKVSGRPGFGQQMRIATAYVAEKGERTNAVIASIEQGGIENVAWRKSVSAIDRLLLNVRQARGPGKHPFIDETIRELQKEQLALKGVKPALLAAISSSKPREPIKGLNTVIRELSEDLGITVRQGNSKKFGYKKGIGVIRQKAYYDFAALTNALPEAMLEVYGKAYQALVQKHSSELSSLTSTNDPTVGHYEFFQLYLTSASDALKRAPKFYNEFEDYLERTNPRGLATLQSAQFALQEYAKADPVAVAESMITSAENTHTTAKVWKAIQNDGVYNTLKYGVLWFYSSAITKTSAMESMTRNMLRSELEQTGRRLFLNASEHPTKIQRLLPYTQQAATIDIKDGIELSNGMKVSQGVPDILRVALGNDMTSALDTTPGSKYSHFLTYLVSLRARHLWDEFSSGRLERPPCITPQDVLDSAIDRLETENPSFADAQRELNKFTRGILKVRLEEGMLTKKQYDRLVQDKYYVPFQRSFDEETAVLFDKKSGFNAAAFDKKISGSNRDIIDPILSIMKSVYATRTAAGMNKLAKSLVRLSENIGPQAGKYVERLSAQHMKALNISVEEVVQNAAKQAGLSSSDTADLKETVLADLGSDAIATIFRPEQIKAGNKPIMFFMENGELQALQINDANTAKFIFDSFSLLGDTTNNWLIDALSLTTQIQRASITTAIPYIFATLIRDFGAAPGYDRRMIPFVSQAGAAVKIFRGDPIVKEYIRSGGLMGGALAHGLEQRRLDDSVQKLIALGYGVDKSTSLSDFFRKWTTKIEVTEFMTRLPMYEHAKKRALSQGLSEMEARAEAAFFANDYSDYASHGSKTEAIRKMIAFWNAGVKGVERFAKTIISSGDTGSNYSLMRPYLNYKFGQFDNRFVNPQRGAQTKQQILSSGTLTYNDLNQLDQSFWAFAYWVFGVGAISIILHSLFKDDPMVRDVPEEIKATHWIFPVGNVFHIIPKESLFDDALRSLGFDERSQTRLPKPFESAWLANLFERLLWEQQKEDPNWLDKFKKDFFSATVPPSKPAWVGLYDIYWSGQDPQTGKQLLTRKEKELAPEDQYKPYTSEFAKWLGGKAGWSPIYIDATLNHLGTTWARDLTSLNIPGTLWYNDRKPLAGVDRYIIVSRFTWAEGKGSIATQRLREMTGQQDLIEGVFSRMSVPFSALDMSYKTYAERVRNSTPDMANQWLSQRSPRERGYAILMAGASGRGAKIEKLDPINRASAIGENSYQIQKELTRGVLAIGKDTKKVTKLPITANIEASAKRILTQIQAQEAFNALTLTGEPGYAKQELIDVGPLYEELKLISPEIHAELKRRNDKDNVLPFSGVQKVWPELQKRLESNNLYKDAQEGHPERVKNYIQDLWFKAKYPVSAQEGAVAR